MSYSLIDYISDYIAEHSTGTTRNRKLNRLQLWADEHETAVDCITVLLFFAALTAVVLLGIWAIEPSLGWDFSLVEK